MPIDWVLLLIFMIKTLCHCNLIRVLTIVQMERVKKKITDAKLLNCSKNVRRHKMSATNQRIHAMEMVTAALLIGAKTAQFHYPIHRNMIRLYAHHFISRRFRVWGNTKKLVYIGINLIEKYGNDQRRTLVCFLLHQSFAHSFVRSISVFLSLGKCRKNSFTFPLIPNSFLCVRFLRSLLWLFDFFLFLLEQSKCNRKQSAAEIVFHVQQTHSHRKKRNEKKT